MNYYFALLQAWRQLDFNPIEPQELERIPTSGPFAVVVLVLLTLMLWKARRNYKALPELAKMPDSSGMPDVTVVIPARNEAGMIALCIQSFDGVPVVVVNDDSTDRTAAIASQAGARVIDAPPVHSSVAPKPNALVAGAAGLQSEYIFFTDADARFQKAFLPSAVTHAKRNELILLTAFLRRECLTIAAKMLVPYQLALYFTGVSGKRVNQTLAKDILACGQCMLFQREPYEFFGGHRPVLQGALDDLDIAEVVKRHRMRVQVVRAEDLGSIRYLNSLGSLWRGFRRTSFPMLRRSARLAVQVVFTALLLASIGPIAAWLAYERQWPFLAVFLILPVLLFKPWHRGWLGPLLYLPAIYLFGCISLHSMFTSYLGLEMTWRGRKV